MYFAVSSAGRAFNTSPVRVLGSALLCAADAAFRYAPLILRICGVLSSFAVRKLWKCWSDVPLGWLTL